MNGEDRQLGLFCNHQAGENVEALEAVLDQDTVHSLGAVEKGMGWVVDVVPSGEIDLRGEELGLDDQKPSRLEELVEAGEFELRIVKMFGHFAAYDKVVGGAERLRVWDEHRIVGGHGVTLFTQEFGNDRASSSAVV